VLLHCVACQSRTPTVAALYGARRQGISGVLALQDMAKRRVQESDKAVGTVVAANRQRTCRPAPERQTFQYRAPEFVQLRHSI
jgi:protein-tyrosine phosphatase